MNIKRLEKAADTLLRVIEEETGLKYKKVGLHQYQGMTAMAENQLPKDVVWEHLYNHASDNNRTVYAYLGSKDQISFHVAVEGQLEGDGEEQ